MHRPFRLRVVRGVVVALGVAASSSTLAFTRAPSVVPHGIGRYAQDGWFYRGRYAAEVQYLLQHSPAWRLPSCPTCNDFRPPQIEPNRNMGQRDTYVAAAALNAFGAEANAKFDSTAAAARYADIMYQNLQRANALCSGNATVQSNSATPTTLAIWPCPPPAGLVASSGGAPGQGGGDPTGSSASDGQAGTPAGNRVLDAAQSILHDPARDQRLGAELQSGMQEDEDARGRFTNELRGAATAADSARLVRARIVALRAAADQYDRQARPSVGGILQTIVTGAAVFDRATSGHSGNAADAGSADLDRDTQRRDALSQQAQRLRQDAMGLEALSWTLSRGDAGTFAVTSRRALTCDGLPTPVADTGAGAAALRYAPGTTRYRVESSTRAGGQAYSQHMVISATASEAQGNLAFAVTVDSFALVGMRTVRSVQAVRGHTFRFVLTPSGNVVSTEPADTSNPYLTMVNLSLPHLLPHLPAGPISTGSVWSDTVSSPFGMPGVVSTAIGEHLAAGWVSRNGARALQLASTSFIHYSGSYVVAGMGTFQADGLGRSAQDALLSADGVLLASVQRDSLSYRTIVDGSRRFTGQTLACTTVTRLP